MHQWGGKLPHFFWNWKFDIVYRFFSQILLKMLLKFTWALVYSQITHFRLWGIPIPTPRKCGTLPPHWSQGYPIIMYGSKKLEILSSYPIFTKPSGIVAFIDISFISIHFGRFLHFLGVVLWFAGFLGQNARKCEKQAIYSSTWRCHNFVTSRANNFRSFLYKN